MGFHGIDNHTAPLRQEKQPGKKAFWNKDYLIDYLMGGKEEDFF